MSEKKNISILIAEDEADLLELYVLLIGVEFDANFFEAANGEIAVQMLQANPNIDLVVSDFNMPKGTGLDVYKATRADGKNIPFVLVTSDHLDDHPEFIKKPATGYVQKPFSEQGLYVEIKRVMSEVSAPSKEKDSKYIPISVATLLKIRKISKPLFVMLSDDKYVKIANENSEFTQAESERFIQKGVNKLYVLTGDFNELVLEFKTAILNEMLFKGIQGRKSEAIKLSNSVQELVAGAIKTFGISDATAQLAEKNIQMVGAVLEATPELQTIFDLLNDHDSDEGSSHSVLISYAITALSRVIEIPHKYGIEILSMAAFFHDVILDENQQRNEAKFINGLMMGSGSNKADQAVVAEHMAKTLAALSPWKSAPPELAYVISQHHERPDGSGFPLRLDASKIHELSAIFILVHDFVEIYKQSKNKESVIDQLNKKQIHYSHPKFKPYFEALLKLIS